jgi:hypothetical protein
MQFTQTFIFALLMSFIAKVVAAPISGKLCRRDLLLTHEIERAFISKTES